MIRKLFFLVFLFVLLAGPAYADSVQGLSLMHDTNAYDITEAQRQTIAERMDWVNMSVFTNYGTKSEAITKHKVVSASLKSYNPEIIVTAHKSGRAVGDTAARWDFDECDGTEALFEHDEEDSPCETGDRVYKRTATTLKIMDITNPAWAAEIASWMADLNDSNTDGYVLDDCWGSIAIQQYHCSGVVDRCYPNTVCTGPGSPVACCTEEGQGYCCFCKYVDDATYKSDMSDHMDAIKADTNMSGKIVVWNAWELYEYGDGYAPTLDGVIIEEFIFEEGDGDDIANVAVAEDDIDDLIKASYTAQIKAVAVPKDTLLSDYQRRVALAAFLIGQHPTRSYYHIMQKTDGNYAHADMFPEYYSLNMGTPTGDNPTELNDLLVGGKTKMYARTYSGGLAVLNLHSSSQDYNTSQNYYKLEPKAGGTIGADGSITGCWTTTLLTAGPQSIPSEDALILVTEEPENVCHAACLRNDGSAGSKVQAIKSDCENASQCINEAVYNTETFSAGDKILICPNGGAFDSAIDIDSTGVTYVASYDPVNGWPVFNEGVILSGNANFVKGSEMRPGIAESPTKSMEGGRFAVCSDTTRIWQAAEETPIINWRLDTPGIFAIGIGSVGGGVGDVTPQLYWRNVSDSGTFAAVAGSGEIKYSDPGGCLTDESNVISGEQGVTSSKEYVTCVTCEQENSHQATSATNLADNKWAELQVGVSFADADPGDDYEFALYENGTQVGPISLATVTIRTNTYNYDSKCVAHWDMEGDFNDNCQFNDLTNDGVSFNSSSPLWGTYDADFELNETDELAIINTNQSADFPGKLGGATSFTACARINMETTNINQAILGKYDNNDDRSWLLVVNSNNKVDWVIGYDISGSNTSVTIPHSSTLSASTPYLVCAFYDESTDDGGIMVRLASNCSTVGSDVDDTDVLPVGGVWHRNSDEFNVGAFNNGAAWHFDGRMDEVIILKKELTPAEVTDICNDQYGS